MTTLKSFGTLTIKVDPSPAKIAKLFGPDLQKEFSDYRPAWRELLPMWADGLERNIRSEGRSLGERWPKLDPSTIRIRQATGGGTKPHIATGRMVSRVQTKLGLSKRKLAVGPRDSYPYILHFGSKDRGIPARRFMGVSPQMQRDGERVVDRFIELRLNALADRIAAITSKT